ncbi:RNA 2',3'-cyclic phosphodiesterase [uncultured Thalassospira sp.]|jgi:2'-5' RNA ligase|uniref:RNA 2',3'-cyclic phosphodiesterase n=1 Tax=uncultured Thalassospira sp. TaxID=404382 RepID=UPI0030D87929|tara:strand:+ start:7396 stop:8025 length:630 start_codon:yes stop_codon:yes gene_type:complete
MRLFVGIPIPADIAQDLYPIARAIRGLEAQTPENMHLTLKFIGNVQDRIVAAQIDDALLHTRFSPFDLQVAGLGMFGTDRKARILWAAVLPQPVLTQLAHRVESALFRCDAISGQLDRRKFAPHITLGRNRSASRAVVGQAVADHADLASRAFRVTRFCLYQSISTRDGPVYQVMAEYGEGIDVPAPEKSRTGDHDVFADIDFSVGPER